MTQKDKELLLKDLCARLPYGVKCENSNHVYGKNIFKVTDIRNNGYICGIINNQSYWAVFNPLELKPYLYPLSSMTEEQKKEYNRLKHEVPVCHYEYGDVVEEIELYDSPESFEYLIENHFDYRGLIEKGLAIDATGLNIYYL